MRVALQNIIGPVTLSGIIGTFSRISDSNPIETILLKNLKDEQNNILTDHIWITKTSKFQNIELDRGDIISFCARIRTYKKRNGGGIDYKLSYITNIKIIGTDYSLNRTKKDDDVYWQVRRIKEIARKKYYLSLENGNYLFTKEDYNNEINRANKILDEYKKEKEIRFKSPPLKYYQ